MTLYDFLGTTARTCSFKKGEILGVIVEKPGGAVVERPGTRTAGWA